jgi:hypothetical protein
MSGTRANPLAALVAALLFAVAFVSFQTNAFAVVSDDVRSGFEAQSDRLVYDAMERAAATLGTTEGGVFLPYRSQAGGQLMLYRVLGLPSARVGDFGAAALAAVVAAMFLCLRRVFGDAGAVVAAVTLALSPWLVAFAGSAYWAAWSWYLPFLVTLAAGHHLFTGGWRAGAVIAALFAAFCFRFLSGYEFITVIVIAALAPVVFWGVHGTYGRWRTLRALIVVGMISITAFTVAIGVHTRQLSEAGLDAREELITLATKRTHAADPIALATAACRLPPSGMAVAECRAAYVASLDASSLGVLAIYATFRRSVPWLAAAGSLDAPELAPARAALRQRNLSHALALARAADGGLKGVAAAAATVLLCWGLMIAAAVLVVRDWPTRRAEAALLLFALAAPLSWFILAKGHAAAHTHLAFVLWTLPLLPLLAGFVGQGMLARPGKAGT